MRTRLLLTILAVMLLAACGDPNAPADGADGSDGSDDGANGSDDYDDYDDSSPAGSWVLVDSDPQIIDIPDNARITLTVTGQDDTWQVGGTAACNSYGGDVVTDGSAWTTEGYGATEMGCEEPLMQAESDYLNALVGVDKWERPSTDELVLSGPDYVVSTQPGARFELRFELLPPVPTADLVDTTWVLDGLIDVAGSDGSVSSTVAGADEATLRLESDGTVEASTGCRTFSGEWIETGDEILLPTFGQRDDSPNVAPDGTTTCNEDVVRQEDHVLSVLGDGFRAAVDGRRLTLTSRDGLGLSYRAAEN